MTAPVTADRYAEAARREFALCPEPSPALVARVGLIVQPALRALAGQYEPAEGDAA
jgi:hypothetical protein